MYTLKIHGTFSTTHTLSRALTELTSSELHSEMKVKCIFEASECLGIGALHAFYSTLNSDEYIREFTLH